MRSRARRRQPLTGRRHLRHAHGGYDAETGERISSFALPDGADTGLDSLGYGATFWENTGTVVFPMATGERSDDQVDDEWYYDAYVPVRCSLATGDCERIPHPVGMVGQLAR